MGYQSAPGGRGSLCEPGGTWGYIKSRWESLLIQKLLRTMVSPQHRIGGEKKLFCPLTHQGRPPRPEVTSDLILPVLNWVTLYIFHLIPASVSLPE